MDTGWRAPQNPARSTGVPEAPSMPPKISEEHARASHPFPSLVAVEVVAARMAAVGNGP